MAAVRGVVVGFGAAGATVAIAGALWAQPALARAPVSFFGANVQPMVKLQVVEPARWHVFARRMAADGLRLARGDLPWAYAEPQAPQAGQHKYVWNVGGQPARSLDQVVGLFARHDIEYVPVISTAPGWASAPGIRVKPAHYGDLAAFAAALATRYGRNGTFWRERRELKYVPITRYEVWTEANSIHSWSGRPDPADYAAGLRLVSHAIRTADPSAVVMASIGWQDFESYTRRLYAQGIKGLVDGIAFHPYAPHGPAIVDLVVRLRRVLRDAGDGERPIYVTETGMPAAPSGAGARYAHDGPVGDRTRAATQSFAGDVLARSNCGVRDYLVYSLVASGVPNRSEPGGEPFMGMYDLGANANATGAALREASKRLRGRSRRGSLLVCGSSEPRAAKRLRLGLRATPDSNGCIATKTTYRGNPLEGALVAIRTAAGRVRSAQTDAFGRATHCLLSDERPGGSRIRAVVPRMATSGPIAIKSVTEQAQPSVER